MLSSQILGATALVLSSLNRSAASVLLFKHLGAEYPYGVDANAILSSLIAARPEAVNSLLADIVGNESSVRADAAPKYVFESRMKELLGWLAHDGWEVVGHTLVANAPAIEESTELRSRLLEMLSSSSLREKAAIVKAIEDSAKSFAEAPPLVNEATTNIRIALETIVRSGAKNLARSRQIAPPDDGLGSALLFLRSQGLVTLDEERGIAAAYKFISPGAHVPKGITDVEWARLVRTIALSMCYFLALCLAQEE